MSDDDITIRPSQHQLFYVDDVPREPALSPPIDICVIVAKRCVRFRNGLRRKNLAFVISVGIRLQVMHIMMICGEYKSIDMDRVRIPLFPFCIGESQYLH